MSIGQTAKLLDCDIEYLAQNMNYLEYLNLTDYYYNTTLSEMSIKYIGQHMQNLRTLVLRLAATDNWLKRVCQIKTLVDLKLLHAKVITDFGVNHICTGMQQLTTLHIVNCRLMSKFSIGNIVKNLQRLTDLRIVWSSCGTITSDEVKPIMEMKNLEKLDLRYTVALDDTTIALFSTLTNLKLFKYTKLRWNLNDQYDFHENDQLYDAIRGDVSSLIVSLG